GRRRGGAGGGLGAGRGRGPDGTASETVGTDPAGPEATGGGPGAVLRWRRGLRLVQQRPVATAAGLPRSPGRVLAPVPGGGPGRRRAAFLDPAGRPAGRPVARHGLLPAA